MLIILVLCLAAQQIDGNSINRNSSDLIEDIEEFRNMLVGLPDEFFDLELAIHNLDIVGENDTLTKDITNFRKHLSGMQDELFDIELALNNLLNKDDGSDDGSDDDEVAAAAFWCNINHSVLILGLLHCKYLQWKYRFYICPFFRLSPTILLPSI